ncbi:MAG TPA: sigma-70 family RNA polymerase sigma factor [Acidimicrobiales bacterium]|nr:sigma-70 family RNA polymerase sigma factor [Acidimicrobiales bacterium]
MGAETEEQPVPSWEEVARTYGRFLYTVAYRLTGNEADAEDLAQEVLLRVRRGLATYRPGSMEGWLSRITTNAFLDDVRRKRRRPAVVMADPPDSLLPAAPAPDEALAATTLPDRMQAALARLPQDFRAAVVLCDVVGESYEQIAESLGIPIGTVRSRIHRARALLRQALSDDGEGDEA